MADEKRIAALAGRTTRELRELAADLAGVATLLRERPMAALQLAGLDDESDLVLAQTNRLATRVLALEALANEHMALSLALVRFDDTPPPARDAPEIERR